jgi:hypothetical protein
MTVRKRWSDLSERNRRLIIVGAAVEGALKAAALVDIKRRPADEVRGAKVAWVVGITLVNSFGAAPLAYFRFGRRKGSQVAS